MYYVFDNISYVINDFKNLVKYNSNLDKQLHSILHEMDNNYYGATVRFASDHSLREKKNK